jgi:hypothetical protein
MAETERQPENPQEEPGPEFDPTATDYNEAGVDLTLIRWSLRKCPAERLEFHVSWLNGLLEMLNAGSARRCPTAEDSREARG